jgi:predicted O-methyltransferase YrrM
MSRVEGLDRRLTTLRSELFATELALDKRLTTVESHVDVGAPDRETVSANIAAMETSIGEMRSTSAELQTAMSEIEGRVKFSNYSNAPGVRMHTRQLATSDVEHIRNHWLRHFGLTMSDRELRYMAHKICLDEDRCEGRIASTIQAAMLRALALLSIKSDVVELLEIGTLCGISAGSLHRIGARAQRIVRLTLIDPLAGYYETSINDGQTGVPITRDVVVRNMGELGVDPSNYRIIQRLSTDPEAVAEASDREYDFVMVDGDHSLQGVASDFELYGRLVSRGGLLIFDDYDTSDWPAIKSYVDEHVRPMGEWLWIGGDWRTAILRRKLDPAST